MPFGRTRKPRSGRRRARARADVFAALDLGTNNCRMLVARPAPAGIQVVESFSRIVRLGEGLEACGQLAEAAIARTIAALKVCAAMLRRHRLAGLRAVATEACRRAGNGGEFLARVERETGLRFEPITCEEEARLTLAGCAPLLDCERPRAIVFDVGGGSTELIWVEPRAGAAPRLLGVRSLPFGVVTLSERIGGGALAPHIYESLIAEVDAALAGFDREHGIGAEVAAGRVSMLGTSGTVTTLGGLYLDLARYDRARVDGLTMEFPALAAISRRLAAMEVNERARHPCIGRERADLVVVGCAILEAVCRRWPVGRLRAADRGIREGLLLAMMATAGARADLPAPAEAAPA